MSWDGQGRRPVRDKQDKNRTLRKLMLGVLRLPSIGLLETVELSQALQEAFVEAYSLESFKARRRIERHLVNLLRQCDESIIQQLTALIADPEAAQSTQQDRLTEVCQGLLQGGNTALSELIAQYPGVDIQRLRQLVRNAKKQQGTGKTASVRDLEQLVAELLAQ